MRSIPLTVPAEEVHKGDDVLIPPRGLALTVVYVSRPNDRGKVTIALGRDRMPIEYNKHEPVKILRWPNRKYDDEDD